MASTRSSPAVSSITQQSDSRNSSSTTNSVTSSASGGWNIAYALAAVPATIAESDLSQTLDYSKMTDGMAALIATDSSGHRSSGEEQQSDDEEMIIKEQLEIMVATRQQAENIPVTEQDAQYTIVYMHPHSHAILTRAS